MQGEFTRAAHILSELTGVNKLDKTENLSTFEHVLLINFFEIDVHALQKNHNVRQEHKAFCPIKYINLQ